MMHLGRKQAAGFAEDDATVFAEATEPARARAAGDEPGRAGEAEAGRDHAAGPVAGQAPGRERAAAG